MWVKTWTPTLRIEYSLSVQKQGAEEFKHKREEVTVG